MPLLGRSSNKGTPSKKLKKALQQHDVHIVQNGITDVEKASGTHTQEYEREYSWTLYKCWSRRMYKAFEMHKGLNYQKYTKFGLAKKFYTTIHGEKLGINLNDLENYYVFEIKDPGKLESKKNGVPQLVTTACEVRYPNDTKNKNKEAAEWFLTSHKELAQTLFHSLFRGDYLAIWGAQFNSQSRTAMFNIDDNLSSKIILALYRHDGSFEPQLHDHAGVQVHASSVDSFFSLNAGETEYIVQQIYPFKQPVVSESENSEQVTESQNKMCNHYNGEILEREVTGTRSHVSVNDGEHNRNETPMESDSTEGEGNHTSQVDNSLSQDFVIDLDTQVYVPIDSTNPDNGSKTPTPDQNSLVENDEDDVVVESDNDNEDEDESLASIQRKKQDKVKRRLFSDDEDDSPNTTPSPSSAVSGSLPKMREFNINIQRLPKNVVEGKIVKASKFMKRTVEELEEDESDQSEVYTPKKTKAKRNKKANTGRIKHH